MQKISRKIANWAWSRGSRFRCKQEFLEENACSNEDRSNAVGNVPFEFYLGNGILRGSIGHVEDF